MSKRKYLIGAALTAVMSISVVGVAQAAYTLQNQRLEVDASAPKLDKKKRTPINSLFVDVITDYTGTTGAVDKKANRTKLYFPKDWQFYTNGIPECDPNAIGGTTEAALAACGPGSPIGNSQVGSGSAETVGPIPGVTAVVTAFNGTKSGGASTILLHSRSSAGTTSVLIGKLVNSDIGGFGRMLDVTVPALPAGQAISDFKTTIPKSTIKRKLPGKKNYIMAKCSGKKKWNFRADSSYDTGAPLFTPAGTTSATAQDKCKQKKKKKKKKKKK
jgi:hypothetical protein